MHSNLIAAAAAATLFAMPAAAAVIVTYENPGVQDSTVAFQYVGVERFEGFATGAGQTVGTTFGGSPITGQYTNLQVDPVNQYGSAGGVGKHANAPRNQAGYSLSVSTLRPEGVNYFGYWLSALDGGNILDFYNGATLVHSFTPGAVLASIGGNSAYFCNPNAPYTSSNCREPYAFVNIFFTGGDTFDRIHLYERAGAGGNYESDNHTVGLYKEIVGNPVPEPATWAMLIAGFGLVGVSMRLRENGTGASMRLRENKVARAV